MEQFIFKSTSINENSLRLYVGVDEITPIENNKYSFNLDGVERRWFEFFGTRKIIDILPELTPYLISAEFNNDFYKWYQEIQENYSFSSWFEIVLTKEDSAQKAIYYQDNQELPEETKSYISSIRPLLKSDDIVKQLNSFFTWDDFEISSIDKIEKALNKPQKAQWDEMTTFKLNVFNVGQGSMSAITTNRNIPLLYFDLGGGYFFNAPTYPTTKALCFTYFETTVISHWDLDHIETARRYTYRDWSKFDNKNWIVPKQNITPFYFRIAAKMASNGNLLVWDGLPSIRFWGGELIRCLGPEKNHNGIALIVRSPRNDIQAILHPADAAYRYIPGVMDMNFDGLVATHHGANFDFNNSPIPKTIGTDGCIAFSHGNRYGHPTPFSISEHRNCGWDNILETTNGSISFTFSRHTMNTPCHGQCSLAISQVFP